MPGWHKNFLKRGTQVFPRLREDGTSGLGPSFRSKKNEDPYWVYPPGLSKSPYFQTLPWLLVVKDGPGPYTAVRNGKG